MRKSHNDTTIDAVRNQLHTITLAERIINNMISILWLCLTVDTETHNCPSGIRKRHFLRLRFLTMSPQVSELLSAMGLNMSKLTLWIKWWPPLNANKYLSPAPINLQQLLESQSKNKLEHIFKEFVQTHSAVINTQTSINSPEVHYHQ